MDGKLCGYCFALRLRGGRDPGRKPRRRRRCVDRIVSRSWAHEENERDGAPLGCRLARSDESSDCGNSEASGRWRAMNVSPRTLLCPLSVLYGAVVRVRVWLYAQRWLIQKLLKHTVISCRKLTVGGTGKTPMVIWLAV